MTTTLSWERLRQALELDARFAVRLEAWDIDTIATVRKAGRAAARRIGHHVVTHQTNPHDREDERVIVIVALRGDDLAPDDEDRFAHRMRDALQRLGEQYPEV